MRSSLSWTERWPFASLVVAMVDKRVDPRTLLPAELLRRIAELCDDDQTRCSFRRTCRMFRACGDHSGLFPTRLLATVDLDASYIDHERLSAGHRLAVREIVLGHRDLMTYCGHDDCDRRSTAATMRHNDLIGRPYELSVTELVAACPNLTTIISSVCLFESARFSRDFDSSNLTRLELDGGCGRAFSHSALNQLRHLRHLVIVHFRGDYPTNGHAAAESSGWLSSVETLDLDMDIMLPYKTTVASLVFCCSGLKTLRLRAPLEHNPFSALSHLVGATLDHFEFCGKTHLPDTSTAAVVISNPCAAVLQESGGGNFLSDILDMPGTEIYRWENSQYGQDECRRIWRAPDASVPVRYQLDDTKNYCYELVPFPAKFLNAWYAPRYTQQQQCCLGLESRVDTNLGWTDDLWRWWCQ